MTMLAPEDRARIRAALLTEVAGTDAAPGRIRWRLRRPGVAVAASAILVAAGAGSATAVVLHQRSVAAAPAGSARCYSQVSRDKGESFPGATVIVGNPGLNLSGNTATVNDPVPLCVKAWRVGILPGTEHQPPLDQNARHPVPDLAACVDAAGSVSVYPGKPQVCASVGMAIDSNSEPYTDG